MGEGRAQAGVISPAQETRARPLFLELFRDRLVSLSAVFRSTVACDPMLVLPHFSRSFSFLQSNLSEPRSHLFACFRRKQACFASIVR